MNEQGESPNCDHMIRAHKLCIALIDIMASINPNHDIDEILHKVLEQSCLALGSESARIAMREGDNWVIRYVTNLPDDLIGRSFTDEELPHAALAMRTNKPVAIDDAFHDDMTNTGMMESLGIKSSLVLPLMEKNEVTGTLFFDYHSRAVPFTDAELDYAGRLTAGIDIALENAHLYHNLEESKKLADALNEIDNVLYSTKDYDVTMNRMLQLATDVIGAESAVIFSKEGDRWVTRYVYKLSESLVGQSFSNTEVMHTAITAETKRSLVVQDVLNNPEIDQKFVEMLGIRSLLDFPLIVRGEVIGDLTFHYHSSPVQFNVRQVDFAHKLQISISLALESGRFFRVAEDAIAARRQAEETRDELRREVTARKQAEAVAESANRAKSQFLANMSHELRTPMTGVLGMLDLVLLGNLEAEQREFICTAHTSARSLVRLLNDILDITKIEMGKFLIEEKPFFIRECVGNTFNILLLVAKSKGLDLNFKVADDVPEALVGDQTRLNQVLTNLAGNAVKFSGKGKVDISVTAGSSIPGGKREVTFTITDTGIGIPDDKKDLLFRIFSQVDESNTRSYGGSGLGLAISKGIVERMGGTITFTSEEGKGSTFSFTIPFGEAKWERGFILASGTTATPGDAPRTEEIRKPRLLVAEDEQVIRQVLRLMLQKANYEIDFAENGQKAVEMWESGKYELILMDVQMPILNGYEATRSIREKELTRGGRIPIVALTAHASKEDEHRCLDAGMDAYVSKPIDFKSCLQLIGETLKINPSSDSYGDSRDSIQITY